MEFVITTYSTVGPIAFGDERESVRSKLNAVFEAFKKGGSDVDGFNNLGIHVHYDSSLRVEAIEFFRPAIPRFRGIDLLSVPYNELVEKMRLFDKDVEEEDAGFTSYMEGIGGYAPFKDEEPHLVCEAVIAFKKNYYST